MRITHNRVLTIASAVLFCSAVAAQEPSEGSFSSTVTQTELKPGDVRASNLLGAMVKRLSGDAIGEVEELIVSADADVRLAVISVGGILGLGAKTIAIPFDQLTIAPDGSAVYLSISEDDLRARPAFDLEGNDAELHSAAAEPFHAVPEQQPAQEPNELVAVPAEPQAARDAIKEKATKQPASALIGAEVVDEQNIPVGRVSDLVVTAEPPEVQVVLELGGEAASASSRFVAVPLAELMISRGHEDSHGRLERVETPLTVSQLQVLPAFEF